MRKYNRDDDNDEDAINQRAGQATRSSCVAVLRLSTLDDAGAIDTVKHT